MNGISVKHNPTPYILEILQKALIRKYNREREGTHVSDTIYCPRQQAFRKLIPKISTDQRSFFFFLRGEAIHKGIEDLLKEYDDERFTIEETIGFKGKEVHTLTKQLHDYEIKATSDIYDKTMDMIIDIKSVNKTELPYGAIPSHLNQLAYYMTIMDCPKGQLLYILLHNDGDLPFVAFDIEVSEEWRTSTKRRLILETRDIEDAVELNQPKLARHVRFDDRYNWKCNDCQYIMECNEHLKEEINLPRERRAWWDKGYNGKQRSLEIPEKWKNKNKK